MRHKEFWSENENPVVQGLVKGELITYHACSTNPDLDKAKEFYRDLEYVGTSDGIYIDGVYQFKNIPHHLFIRKTNQTS